MDTPAARVSSGRVGAERAGTRAEPIDRIERAGEADARGARRESLSILSYLLVLIPPVSETERLARAISEKRPSEHLLLRFRIVIYDLTTCGLHAQASYRREA